MQLLKMNFSTRHQQEAKPFLRLVCNIDMHEEEACASRSICKMCKETFDQNYNLYAFYYSMLLKTI